MAKVIRFSVLSKTFVRSLVMELERREMAGQTKKACLVESLDSKWQSWHMFVDDSLNRSRYDWKAPWCD